MFKFIADIAAFLDKLTECSANPVLPGDPPGTIYKPMTLLEVRHLMNTGEFESDMHLQQMMRISHEQLQETMAMGEAALVETMNQAEAEQRNSTWNTGGFGGGFGGGF